MGQSYGLELVFLPRNEVNLKRDLLKKVGLIEAEPM
jgi:hypothetical protein